MDHAIDGKIHYFKLPEGILDIDRVPDFSLAVRAMFHWECSHILHRQLVHGHSCWVFDPTCTSVDG